METVMKLVLVWVGYKQCNFHSGSWSWHLWVRVAKYYFKCKDQISI